MLTFLHSDVPKFSHGEYVILRATTTTVGASTFTAYAVGAAKYIDGNGDLTDTSTAISSTVSTLPDTSYLHTMKLNTTSLANDDLVVITATFDGVTYTEYVEVGSFAIADSNITVEVYGYLRDAYGRAVANSPIVFTVMNTTTYFDNSPSTSMTATILTDDKGKFMVKLNRNYNYTLSIQQLNYIKTIKLAELPLSASVVEVDLGTGLGQ